MLALSKRGQSMVEYAILLGVVIAALLIMQAFVKRGFQGGLKDAADKMGDQFSAGGTTVYQSRNMGANQIIKEETATGNVIKDFVDEVNLVTDDVHGTVAQGAYSYSARSGGNQTSDVKTATEAAKTEKVRWNEFQNNTVDDFCSTDMGF